MLRGAVSATVSQVDRRLRSALQQNTTQPGVKSVETVVDVELDWVAACDDHWVDKGFPLLVTEARFAGWVGADRCGKYFSPTNRLNVLIAIAK